MPVSKKPRNKARATRAAASPPALPTRRMREAYLADVTLEVRGAALAEADTVMARAMDSGMPRVITAAAYRALALCPLCAEAYTALAEAAATAELALDAYKRAVHAGELALGAAAFEQRAGQFWSTPETRPYMIALRGMADILLELEQEDAAIGHFETLLRLNPADAQGARYPLMAYYLDQHDLAPARALALAFQDERSTFWLYSRVLLAYRDELQAQASTDTLVQDALAANPHVPAILAEQTPDVFADDDEDITPGSAEEATEYVVAYEAAWTSTPGAVAWLLSKAA